MTVLLPAPPLPRPGGGTSRPPRERLQPLAGPGGWAMTLLVTVVAGLVRFVRLDIPYNTPTYGKVFDEVYYACDALNMLRYGVEHVTQSGDLAGRCLPVDGGSFVVHPPLGKWAIAVGIRLFGNSTFGWRFSAAVAGTLTVLVLVRATRRMTGSTLLGGLAGLLLAVDGMHVVHSRVALLDVFLVLWTTAAFACLVRDRDVLRSRLAAAPDEALTGTGPTTGMRWWRLAAGVCLGCAVATKWSGVYYLVVLALLALAWEVGARRTAGLPRPFRATVRRSALGLPGSLVLLPLAVYLLSWTGWFVSTIGWDRHWADTQPPSLVPGALRSLWHYHRDVLAFHEGLSSPHPYQSHAVGWLLLARPVSFYYPPGLHAGADGCQVAQCAREVLDLGNPVLWWGTLPVLVALLWLWASRRDWRASATLALVAAGILPWVRDDLHHRTMFAFYALPAVPFMALGAALVAGWVLGGASATRARRRWGAAGVGLYAALAVAAFAYFYPVLAAVTIPLSSWQHRMWLPQLGLAGHRAADGEGAASRAAVQPLHPTRPRRTARPAAAGPPAARRARPAAAPGARAAPRRGPRTARPPPARRRQRSPVPPVSSLRFPRARLPAAADPARRPVRGGLRRRLAGLPEPPAARTGRAGGHLLRRQPRAVDRARRGRRGDRRGTAQRPPVPDRLALQDVHRGGRAAAARGRPAAAGRPGRRPPAVPAGSALAEPHRLRPADPLRRRRARRRRQRLLAARRAVPRRGAAAGAVRAGRGGAAAPASSSSTPTSPTRCSAWSSRRSPASRTTTTSPARSSAGSG